MDLLHIGICCGICLGQILIVYGVFKFYCKNSKCCDKYNIYTNNNQKNKKIKFNNSSVNNNNNNNNDNDNDNDEQNSATNSDNISINL